MSRNPISSCERTKFTDRNIVVAKLAAAVQEKLHQGIVRFNCHFFFCPQRITDGNVFVNTSFIEVVYQLVPS